MADNTITAVLLNGKSVGFSSSDPEMYRAFVSLTINGGFKAGANTLDVIVENATQTAWPDNLHNPSGLRMQLTGTAQVAAAAPAAPADVAATPDTVQAAVSWKAVPGATSYNIYRSTTKGGEGNTPYQKGVKGTYFSDTNVTGGTTYYYQVTAVDAAGESDKSQEADAKPLGRWTVADEKGQQNTKTLTMNLSVAVIGVDGKRIDKAKVEENVLKFLQTTSDLLNPIVGQGQIEIVSAKNKVVYIPRVNIFIADDKIEKADFQLDLSKYVGLSHKKASGGSVPEEALKKVYEKYKVPIPAPDKPIDILQYHVGQKEKGKPFQVDVYNYPVIAKFVEAILNLKPDDKNILFSLLGTQPGSDGGAFVLPRYYATWVDYVNKTVPGNDYKSQRNPTDEALVQALTQLVKDLLKGK